MADDFHIVIGHPSAVNYAVSVMKHFREEVGFIPRMALDEYAERGGLIIGMLNNEPCGYVLFSSPSRGRDVHLYQIAVPMDVQRRLYGASIVSYVEGQASTAQASGIWLKAAWDIEANHFWKSLGYYCSGVLHGAIKRGRLLNIYRKDLVPQLLTVPTLPIRGPKQRGRDRGGRYEQARGGKFILPFGWEQDEIQRWSKENTSGA